VELVESDERKRNDTTELSVQELVDCAWLFGNQGCHGGNVGLALLYAKTIGVASEDEYPYTATDNRCQRWGAGSHLSKHKISDIITVKPMDEDGLVHTLATYGPVAIAIDASAPEFRFYKQGLFTACPRFAQLNHAVLAIGYDKNSILVQNSWGEGWGDKGRFRLPRGSNACGMLTFPPIALGPAVSESDEKAY
jgi:cathepsin L